MMIRKYDKNDLDALFGLLKREGIDWSDYYNNPDKYTKAINNSIVYIIEKDNILCGYIRCKDDDGYGIYILDLLVDKKYRNQGYGRDLINKIRSEFINEDVYVTSDVDEYYEKLGCVKVGSVLSVK